jgi:hypothetical protein
MKSCICFFSMMRCIADCSAAEKLLTAQEYGRGEPCAREVGEREGDAQSMVK